MVRDIDETSRSIVAAMRDAERMAGVKVNMVTCGIAGEHVSARTSPGVVAVSGDEVTAEDVARVRSEEHTSELQSHHDLVCRLLLEKKNSWCGRSSRSKRGSRSSASSA